MERMANQGPGSLADFLERAQTISRNSWQSRRLGPRIQNDDCEVDRLTQLALLGFLRCYVLSTADGHARGGNVPVAFVIATQCNGEFMYEEIGYDQSFAGLSPGKVLLIKLIEDLYGNNLPQCLDFGGGDAEYKQLFSNRSYRSGNMLLLSPTLRGRMLRGAMAASRLADQTIRRGIARLGLKTRIRQWFRKQSQ